MSGAPGIATDPRLAVAGGGWFGTLTPAARHDLLRVMRVRHHAHGDAIFHRGEPAHAWLACASGAVRISCAASNGRP